MSVTPTVAGVSWSAEGPNLIAPQGYVGAVEAIAVDPNNANSVYVGSVDGGIWHTTPSAPDPFHAWVNQSDHLPSLSIGSIAFSPTNSNVLYAGFAKTSHLANFGGPLDTGSIARTDDGGATWNVVGAATLNGANVAKILPTTIGSGANQSVIVATDQGLYLSQDGGDTWQPVKNATNPVQTTLTGNATDVVPLFDATSGGTDDYAALPGQGVFRSTDGGRSWVAVNQGITGLAGSANIRLAAHDDGVNRVLYAMVSAGSNGQISGVFRSADQGAHWAAMGVPAIPNDPTNPHDEQTPDSPFAADPNNAFRVYLSGYNAPVYVGEFPNAGSPVAGTQWTRLDGPNFTDANNVVNGANNTGTHGDSRAMAVQPDGTLLLGDDGGLFKLTNPTDPTSRGWTELNDGLQITEMVAIGYDNVNHVLAGAAWDNGAFNQGTLIPPLWTAAHFADGGFIGVDNLSTTPAGQPLSIHYAEKPSVNGGFATFTAQTFNASDVLVNNLGVGPLLSNMPAADLNRQGVFVVDTVNAAPSQGPSRLLFGPNDSTAGNAYESLDGGLTVRPLPINDSTGVNSLVLGGRDASGSSANVAFVSYRDGPLYVRGASGSTFIATQFQAQVNLPAGPIAVDPLDWHTVFAAAGGGVYEGTHVDEPGQVETWTKITGNLDAAIGHGDAHLASMVVVDVNGAPVVVVGGLNGVYRAANPNEGSNTLWARLGDNMPNVLIKGLTYDAKDDLLAAATLGRGAWEIQNASRVLTSPTTLTLNADTPGGAGTVAITRDNAGLLDVFLDNTTPKPDLTFDPALVNQVQINAVGTNTHLTLNAGTFNNETDTVNGFFSGTIALDNLTFHFTNIGAIIDPTTVKTFTFNDAPQGAPLTVSDGPSLAGNPSTLRLSSVGNDSAALIDLANKGTTQINGGADTLITINNTQSPTGINGLDLALSAKSSTVTVENTTLATNVATTGFGTLATVSVGDLGNLTALGGVVNVASNALSPTINLIVDDGADPTARSFNVTAGGVLVAASIAHPVGGISLPVATLENVTISPATVLNLTVKGGSGGNQFNVAGTPNGAMTTILSGAGADVFNINAIGGSTTVSTGNGNDGVNVSSDAPANIGNLAGLGGNSLNLLYGSGSNTLNVSEATSPNADQVTVTGTAITGGTGPYTIRYSTNGGSFGGGVNLTTGLGNDSVVVESTASTGLTSLYTSGGNDAVTVDLGESTPMNLTVAGGSGSNTVFVTDPTRKPELTNSSVFLGKGTVTAKYDIVTVVNGRIVSLVRTITIPYTGFGSVTLLPDADHSFTQALYHGALARDGTLPELNAWIKVLHRRGIGAVVSGIERSSEARRVAKLLPPVVVKNLSDYAVVYAELHPRGPKPRKGRR